MGNQNSHNKPKIKQQQISPNNTNSPKFRELPGISFKYTNESDLITDTECCICFYNYRPGMIMPLKLFLLPCNHIIHKQCLDLWYHKSQTCPICRFSLHSNINQNP